jgi:hypothetical protein
VADVIVMEEEVANRSPEFSWRAVFAGSVVAVSVTFFLLLLGSGVGLSLVSVPETSATTAKSALTLGAVYFFASQAFGLAVGGYLAGRLMGPVLETESEELFHSTTHGLVVWAVSVVAMTTMVTISGLVAASSAVNAAAILGAANTQNQRQVGITPETNGYWVDILFRPASRDVNAAAVALVPPPETRADTEARAEAGRILTAGLARGELLSQDDHGELVRLVSRSTGAKPDDARRRVDEVQTRIHQQEIDAAEAARIIAKYVSLWLAASLSFGALVAAAAAVSARWIDDKARVV